MTLNGNRIWLKARRVLRPSEPAEMSGARGVPSTSRAAIRSPTARLPARPPRTPRSLTDSVDVGAPLVCAPALTEF